MVEARSQPVQNPHQFIQQVSVALVKPTISQDGGRQRQELKSDAGTPHRQTGVEHLRRRIW